MESTGLPDDDVLTEAGEQSESLIDSYLCHRWAVPVDVSAGGMEASLLKAFALDLTLFNIVSRSRSMPEIVRERRENVVTALGEMRDGKAHLPKSTPPAETATRGTLASWGTADTDSSSSNRVFSKTTQGRV